MSRVSDPRVIYLECTDVLLDLEYTESKKIRIVTTSERARGLDGSYGRLGERKDRWEHFKRDVFGTERELLDDHLCWKHSTRVVHYSVVVKPSTARITRDLPRCIGGGEGRGGG